MKKIYLLIYKIFFKNFFNSDTILLGKFFRNMRGIFFKLYTGNTSKNINVQIGARFSKNVKLGDNSGIGERALISNEVSIGNDVMMGPDVIIYTCNHEFKNVEEPMYKQGFQKIKPVTIGNDVWIGARVIILPGVKVGNGVVIGAGSIVTKDIEDYSIVGGNPAKLIRKRK